MKRSKLAAAACGMVLLLGAIGCNSAKQEAPAPVSQAEPATPPLVQDNAALSGKVLETMNSGGYTYLQIENNGKKTWIAAPEAKIKVGQKVSCEPGMEMQNFTSKTLKRTFASIIFSSGIH